MLNLNDRAMEERTRYSPPTTNNTNPKMTQIKLTNIYFFGEDTIS